MFGVLLHEEERYSHAGFWVFWTTTGQVAWSPKTCLQSINEEAKSVLDNGNSLSL